MSVQISARPMIAPAGSVDRARIRQELQQELEASGCCPTCGRAKPRPTRTGRPTGRPRKISEDQHRAIVQLREQLPSSGRRRTWKEISRTVGVPAGTCSWLYSRWRRGKSSAEKGAAAFPKVAPDP